MEMTEEEIKKYMGELQYLLKETERRITYHESELETMKKRRISISTSLQKLEQPPIKKEVD